MVEHRAVYIDSQEVLLACEKGEFRATELHDELDLPCDSIPSDSAIRSILRQLEELGWLARNHPESRIWYASEKLKNMSDRYLF